MTRPQIIRADTIDLQDHDAPSAKDHKHSASKPLSNPNTNGSLAPHQAGTIREVEEERAEEEARNPRVSWANGRGGGNGDGEDDRDLQIYAEELASGIVNSLNGNNKMQQQQDALAIAQNGGVTGRVDDDDDGEMDVNTDDDDLDDDMMDKISSSPSIEDEDIDFEFVYALHTFVATVEGQANATKGDTMVLLDDSNSYWWLVRVVKDSSIGYLPAEHIETPTERLARLNKHRNIDLSATMLGDQAEKTRNPLMTAMKRRKAKTVTFTAPTYVDYSDIDYSDEEGDEDDADGPQQSTQQREDEKNQATSQQATTGVLEDDESAKVEPLKPRSQKQVKVDTARSEEADQGELSGGDSGRRSSDEFFDGKSERTTKNGTVRNTDSFFRDETIETKKITLTPGLLRDDNEPRGSNDSKELRQRPSLEKDLVPDKTRDEKKKKEKDKKDKDKKPSAIRSFFSRKDKKKSLDDDDESFGKRSMDAGAGFGDAEMVEEPEEMDSSPHKGPQRNPSKLQKQQPRIEPSPTRKPPANSKTAADSDRGLSLVAEVKTNNVASAPPVTVRMVESEQPENQVSQARKDEKNKPATSKAVPATTKPDPPKTTIAKSRVELDEFDSSDEEIIPEPTRAPPAEPQRESSDEKSRRPNLPGSFPDSSTGIPQQSEATGIRPSGERLSESPVHISPITSSNPPALMGDSSSQEDRSSPISSPSPEPTEADNSTHRNQDSVTTATSPTTTSTWNDANLRAFFDSGSEIRDLLVVVYDKSDATPVSPNHPIANSLFREQNAKLAEITTQLDNMLGDWLARKQRLRGTV
ncbi:putative sh3 domain-containing protein [Rosellinia necatrix]|uniref:Putative sh3 domain-containing protein n=1 Tax=Rosellinia necatrix TaxID=77044 RepID=A0A1W2TI46_ROSNE|nr:putative sh3 domain-containing protein [Rosellinia necatrix]